MEIWHEESPDQKVTSCKTVDGYLNEFCEALIRLRQQRKNQFKVGKLIDRCQTLQQKIDKRKQRLIVGL